jgi:hypothetical protein
MDNPECDPLNRPMLLRLPLALALAAAGLVFGQIPTPPLFVEQPAARSFQVGDAVSLTGAATGSTPLQYQWRRNGAPVPGATNSTLAFAAVAAADAGTYELVATNAYGTASSAPAALTVNRRPQEITFTSPPAYVPAGGSVTLAARASSGLPVTLTLVSGGASLAGTLLTGLTGNVVVRATQDGDDSYAPAPTVERTFNFITGGQSPFISSPPADREIDSGGTVTLRAAALGVPAPNFQWSKDGTTLAGATASSLTLGPATLADAGRYTVTAMSPLGTSSASATLAVRAAPVVLGGPATQAVFTGDRVSLGVNLTGYPAPTHQWRRNGTALSGATAATLVFPSIRTTDAGRYDVVVTNALGTATSPVTTLTVTNRDFTGIYAGEFANGLGDLAFAVRADRSATLLAHLPGTRTALASADVRIDVTGTFSLRLTTVAPSPSTVTVQGRINELAGTVTGEVPEWRAAFTGLRATSAGSQSLAGPYVLGLVGTPTGGQAIIAPNGQALLVTTAGSVVDGLRSVLGLGGRLNATTSSGANVDLTFAGGLASGSARAGSGTPGTLAGALAERASDRRLVNVAVRAYTGSGAAGLITGFVVAGDGAKQVMVRAAGPSIATAPFNLGDAIRDPSLQVFRGTTSAGQNDDWGANAAAITAAATRVGAFPFRSGSGDAALIGTLATGAYTVTIGGGTGTVLAEVYEVPATGETPGARRLVNLSARGPVSPDTPLIAGFVVAGSAPQLLLIRGVGPTMGAAPFGIAGALPNPQLTLFRGSTVVKTNDDWFRDPDAALIRAAAARSGAFALGATTLDAAMLLFLSPGAYTAQVSGPRDAGSGNNEGLAMVEVYEVTP